MENHNFSNKPANNMSYFMNNNVNVDKSGGGDPNAANTGTVGNMGMDTGGINPITVSMNAPNSVGMNEMNMNAANMNVNSNLILNNNMRSGIGVNSYLSNMNEGTNNMGGSSSGFGQMNKNDESIESLVHQMESSFSLDTDILKTVSDLIASSRVDDKIKGIRLIYASLHYKHKHNCEYRKNLLSRGCAVLNAPVDKNENEETNKNLSLESKENAEQNSEQHGGMNSSGNENRFGSFFHGSYGNNMSAFSNKGHGSNMHVSGGSLMNNFGGSNHISMINSGQNNNGNMNPTAATSSTSTNNTVFDMKTLNSMIFSSYKGVYDVDEYFELLDKCLNNERVIDINLCDIFEMDTLKSMKSILYNYMFHNDEILVETLTLLLIIFGCNNSDKIKQDTVDELYKCVLYMLKSMTQKNCKIQTPLVLQLVIALMRIIICYDTAKLKTDVLENRSVIDLLLKFVENIPNLNGVRVCYTLVLHGLKTFYVSTCQIYEKTFLKELERITNYLSTCIKRGDERILFLASSTCITICENQIGIDILLKTDILHYAVQLCDSFNADLAFEALSIISKIAYAANHQQICILITRDVIQALKKILNNPRIKPGARARACNALGNIGCETSAEVEFLIRHDVFPLLVDIFQTDNDFNTKIEAAYAVCACLSKANQKQVGYIISCTATANRLGQNICMQLIADMLELVSESDPMNNGSVKLCKSILRGLENILDKGDDETRDLSLWENPYVFMFKEVQGDVKLLQMQFFPEYYVVNKTYDILGKYFSLTSTWNNRK